MDILTKPTIEGLWEDTLKQAENRLAVTLAKPLEQYLVSLLIDYTDKSSISHERFAITFLEAKQSSPALRANAMQQIGDKCLLYAGFFPEQADKRLVKLSYFVDMGRAAYSELSRLNHVFSQLTLQFVVLMDVLQTINPDKHLLPLAAYEQWQTLGSQRAFNELRQYTTGFPFKNHW